MITIVTSPEYIAEKEYTCKVLFTEILGVNFKILTENIGNKYFIKLPNLSEIIIADTFFSKYNNNSYLQKSAIPESIELLSYSGIDEKIPVIYGTSKIDSSNPLQTICDFDIIASAFFMLSRWEEMVYDKYDTEGRFLEENSLAIANNFYEIPVVHVYAKLISLLCSSVSFPVKNTFSITATHDIDFILKWNTPFDFAKTIIGDLLKRKSISLAIHNFKMFVNHKDPYDTFDLFIEQEKSDSAIYYFLQTPHNRKSLEKIKIQKIIQKIKDLHCKIGLHSNYYKTNNYIKNQSDIDFFSSLFSRKIEINRQHFLRFRIPDTYELLEASGITEDSSLYFKNYPGFRTGMCIPHSIFNCKTRKTMNIKESPLLLMDVSLINKTDDEIQLIIDRLISICKKYKGNFVYLWHNSSFDEYEWGKLKKWYFYIQKNILFSDFK